MPGDCRDRFNLISWVAPAVGTLLIMIIYVLWHIAQATYMSEEATIVISVVIIVCALVILVAVSCHFTRRRGRRYCVECGAFHICNVLCCRENGSANNKKILTVRGRLGSDCAICLEEKTPLKKEVVQISCAHTYHKTCISKILESDEGATCPKCRSSIEPFTTL